MAEAVAAAQANATIEKHRLPDLGSFDTFEALETWARMQVAAAQERNRVGECMFGSLTGRPVEGDARFRSDLADAFGRSLSLFTDGFTTMRAKGLLRDDADPPALAYGLLSAQQGGMLLSQTLRDAGPLKAALATALGHVRSFATTPDED